MEARCRSEDGPLPFSGLFAHVDASWLPKCNITGQVVDVAKDGGGGDGGLTGKCAP